MENSHQGPLGGNCPAGSHGCRKRGLCWWQKEGDGGGVRSTGLPLPLPPLQAAGPDLAPPLPHPFSPQVPLPRSGHLDCQLQFVPSQHPFPSEAGVHTTLSLLLKPVALAGPEDKAQWPDGIFQSHLTQPLATPPPCPPAGAQACWTSGLTSPGKPSLFPAWPQCGQVPPLRWAGDFFSLEVVFLATKLTV